VTTSQTRFAVEGAPDPEAGHFPVAQLRVVTPGYFSAMAIPLREGRTFSGAEMEPTGPAVCVINESMARRFYGEHSGGRSAIGRKVMLDVLNPKPQATAIVGVVGDTREMDLAQETEPQIYFPGFSAAGTVVLRASQDPLSLSGAIVHEVHAIDPMQPAARIEAMDEVIDASLARRRFSLRLLAGFALLALFLACTGLYGVISYSVEQRTQELGLRQALGGKPSDLMLMILVEGLWLSAIGLAGGAVAAVAATRAMSNLLYQTPATDSLTFAVTGLILGVVSAVSCLAPAWRAARVHPMAALRAE
jgi:predicted permease